MKLVIENANVGPSNVRSVDGKLETWCSVTYMGGQASVQNPKKFGAVEGAAVTIKVALKNEADQWMTKDKSRSGAMLTTSINFVELVEVSSLKK